MAETIKIGGEIESTATGNKVADVANIKDKTKGNKSQAQINAEFETALEERYTKSETYNKTQLENMITTPEIAYKDYDTYADMVAETEHTAGAIYRVANYDGTQAVTNKYAEYSWDGTQYKLMAVRDHGIDEEPTAGSDNLVKSGGVQNELALGAVYDVSAKNPTAGPNNDGKWESLSALLSDANLNTLIPTSVRKGGMSIKFVCSSDNKYVQYRLMTDEWSTTISDWQGVDNEIVAGSKNIADSDAVHKELYDENTVAITFGPSTNKIDTSYVSQNGDIIGEVNSYRIYYFACNKGDKFTITLNASSVTTSARLFAVYSGDTSANFSSETAIEVSEAKLSDNGTYIVRILDDRAKYIAIGTLLSQPNAVSVAKAIYTSKFDTIEEDMINSKSWAPNGNVIYDSNEIPVSCDIKWADGTEGTLSYSNFNEDVFEYTMLTATYKSKTIVYTLTYDSNGYITNETINIQ